MVYEILDANSGKTKRVHFNLLKAESRKNVRDDIGQNALAGDTNDKSSEDEVSFIDDVPTLPAVANAAVPPGTQNAVTAEAAAPNHPASDHLATHPQDFDNSAVPNAPIQSLAEPAAAKPVVSTDNASTVAALPTDKPVAPNRGGVQHYDLQPRPKP